MQKWLHIKRASQAMTNITPHNYEVTEIELIESSSTPSLKDDSKPLNVSINSTTVAKLLNGVEKSYGNKRKNSWSASEVQNNNPAVVSDGLQSEPNADNGSTSNGTPSNSIDKDSNLSEENKGKVHCFGRKGASETSATSTAHVNVTSEPAQQAQICARLT